jgi:hypothetical protein
MFTSVLTPFGSLFPMIKKCNIGHGVIGCLHVELEGGVVFMVVKMLKRGLLTNSLPTPWVTRLMRVGC